MIFLVNNSTPLNYVKNVYRCILVFNNLSVNIPSYIMVIHDHDTWFYKSLFNIY